MSPQEICDARILASKMLDDQDQIEEVIMQAIAKLRSLTRNASDKQRRTALFGIISEICSCKHPKRDNVSPCIRGDVIDGILKVMAPEALKKIPQPLRQELIKTRTGDHKLIENPRGGFFEEPLGTTYPGSVQSEANRNVRDDEEPEYGN